MFAPSRYITTYNKYRRLCTPLQTSTRYTSTLYTQYLQSSMSCLLMKNKKCDESKNLGVQYYVFYLILHDLCYVLLLLPLPIRWPLFIFSTVVYSPTTTNTKCEYSLPVFFLSPLTSMPMKTPRRSIVAPLL